MQNKLPL